MLQLKAIDEKSPIIKLGLTSNQKRKKTLLLFLMNN